MTCTHVHLGGACVDICTGPGMVEGRREDDRVRWCFQCRKHLPHFAVLMVPVGESYYGPHWQLECEGCGEDHADFPGSYRDGPRWDVA